MDTLLSGNHLPFTQQSEVELRERFLQYQARRKGRYPCCILQLLDCPPSHHKNNKNQVLVFEYHVIRLYQSLVQLAAVTHRLTGHSPNCLKTLAPDWLPLLRHIGDFTIHTHNPSRLSVLWCFLFQLWRPLLCLSHSVQRSHSRFVITSECKPRITTISSIPSSQLTLTSAQLWETMAPFGVINYLVV